MDQQLVGKRPSFHRAKRRSNSFRILAWLGLILVAMWLFLRVERGEVRPLLVPTPTPTRMARSYQMEAEAYFQAGKIDDPNTENDAIGTYQQALKEDPKNARAWADLARIQTYSSGMLTTTDQRRSRLAEARDAIGHAVELEPDTGNFHAIRSFVLDWSASYEADDQKQSYLNEAESESVRALQLDPQDGIALAFYAEILLDQGKWTQSVDVAEQAVALSPNSMDVHRVYATVLETGGAYRQAIEEYQAASKINPNLTFLYISIGVIYRHLEQFDTAIDYFTRAVDINKQIGVKDPTPYIAIAKTYSQKGEFFAAARNGERALSLDPADPNTYGQLGIIYFKSKNYESAKPALECAVVGCTAEQNQVLKDLADNYPQYGVTPQAVSPLPLESIEIAYYYAEYGQTLAYLSRPRHNYCDESRRVLEQVRGYTTDSVLLQIVKESENICATVLTSPPSP